MVSSSELICDFVNTLHKDPSGDEEELSGSADLGQWLDDIRPLRVTLRDADPHSALEQEFADVAADESTAAEDGDQLIRAFEHAPALAPPACG